MPQEPPATASGQPQQAPMGVSPATGPTPNAGFRAAAMQRLGLLLKNMTEILPMLGANTEEGQQLLKMINQMAKIVPPGTSTPASERNNIEQMALRNQQNQMMQQQMRGGAQPGAGGAPPVAVPPGMRAA